MSNPNPGASSDLCRPALLLSSLGMNCLLSWVLSVHPGLALTLQRQPKPVTLGCCSSSLCWLMETAPQNQVLIHGGGPARVCCDQHALMPSPAAEVKALGLCEPYDRGSKEGTGVETGGFLFLGRGSCLLQVSEGGAGTVAPEVQWPPAHDQTLGVSLLAWRSLTMFGSFPAAACRCRQPLCAPGRGCTEPALGAAVPVCGNFLAFLRTC